LNAQKRRRSNTEPLQNCPVAAEAKTTIVSGVVGAERPFIGATAQPPNQHHHYHHPSDAKSKKILRSPMRGSNPQPWDADGSIVLWESET
jgi:hypothetical protein